MSKHANSLDFGGCWFCTFYTHTLVDILTDISRRCTNSRIHHSYTKTIAPRIEPVDTDSQWLTTKKWCSFCTYNNWRVQVTMTPDLSLLVQDVRTNNTRTQQRNEIPKNWPLPSCEIKSSPPRRCTTIWFVPVSQDQSTSCLYHFHILRMGSVVNEYFQHAPRDGKKGKHSVSTKLLSNLQFWWLSTLLVRPKPLPEYQIHKPWTSE